MVIHVSTLRGKRFDLDFPEPIEAPELRARVARATGLPLARLRLVAGSRTLPEVGALGLQSEDEVLALVESRLVDVSLTQLASGSGRPDDNDAEAETSFRVPDDAAPWQRSTLAWAQHRRVPDELLAFLSSTLKVRPWIWGSLLAWLCLLPVATRFDFGPPYILLSLITFIFLNLGRRKPGEASAYSIFNNFRALPGQLTADELDRQLRTGQMH